MNSTSNGASIGSLTASPLPIKKNISVQEAQNGYVINLGYGELKIAATNEDLIAIISEYINRVPVQG